MPHELLFGKQVPAVTVVGRNDKRDAVGDPDRRIFKRFHLAGIVRNQLNFADAQVKQYPDSGVVLPGVGVKSEVCIGINRIESHILQVIGFQFVDESDSAPLLPQIDHNAPFVRHHFQRSLQLIAAIAAHGAEYIASHTFGMYPDRYRVGWIEPIGHQREMRHQVGGTVGVGHHGELATGSGNRGLGLSEHAIITVKMPLCSGHVI